MPNRSATCGRALITRTLCAAADCNLVRLTIRVNTETLIHRVSRANCPYRIAFSRHLVLGPSCLVRALTLCLAIVAHYRRTSSSRSHIRRGPSLEQEPYRMDPIHPLQAKTYEPSRSSGGRASGPASSSRCRTRQPRSARTSLRPRRSPRSSLVLSSSARGTRGKDDRARRGGPLGAGGRAPRHPWCGPPADTSSAASARRHRAGRGCLPVARSPRRPAR